MSLDEKEAGHFGCGANFRASHHKGVLRIRMRDPSPLDSVQILDGSMETGTKP